MVLEVCDLDGLILRYLSVDVEYGLIQHFRVGDGVLGIYHADEMRCYGQKAVA